MNVFAEQSRSLWMTVPPVDAPTLDRDIRADVLVIGSGIAGLSCAYELQTAGRHVTVIDRGPIGRGMTARTSAHLSYELDDYYAEFSKLRNEDEARQYYESQRAAVDRIEEIASQEGFDCDFARVDGYLFPHAAADRLLLEAELAACHRIGFREVEWSRLPGTGESCLRFPKQARFHPLKYIDGLARVLKAHGAHVYANSPVVDFDEHKEVIRVQTANGASVVAATVIVASNTPISNTVAIHTKQAPYRTYVFTARVPKGSVPDALMWDTDDPYRYVRIQPDADDDLIIVGGEDHKTGIEDGGSARIDRLYAWAHQRWPQMGPVEHAWSGQVYEPVDAAPYIGPAPGAQRMFIVTGDSGEGLTTGVAASLVLHELVMGREHPAADVYSPDRRTFKAARTYFEENLDVAVNFTEHVHDGHQLDSLEEVAIGAGGVVSMEGKKIAAYRDRDGHLHLCSATCTHVGCVVHWNSFEQCWDCPCHGSQFSVSGEPLNGPAMKPLAAFEPRE